ncbi:OprD family porin, partial [Klebsiella pneumoniae]|uniref:OprD family porin n=1 Tax=Klebsiella pneumoniae TaxID=573 RepID=UPI0021CB4A7C
GGKNSLNRLIRCVCGKKIGPDPRNFNQRVSLGRNDLLIRTFHNIKTAETSNGKEHEWFNQVQYQVQNGMAKDLKLRLRYSVLRVSSNASDYNVSGNEVRFYVEYPFDVF